MILIITKNNNNNNKANDIINDANVKDRKSNKKLY